MNNMNMNNILISGVALWLIGIAVIMLLPVLASFGAVCVLMGQILTAIGVLILVIDVIKRVLS